MRRAVIAGISVLAVLALTVALATAQSSGTGTAIGTLTGTETGTETGTAAGTAAGTDAGAPAGLSAHAAPAQGETREAVFEATVDLFKDYYWDEDRLDWDAWADEYRDRALGAANRGRFDSVMRRMVNEVGDDHSRWLGLTSLDPALTPITPPFEPAGGGDLLAQADSSPSLGLLVRWVAGVGVLVERVLPDTPAAEAGVARGDVIVSVNGADIAEVGAAGVGYLLGSSLSEDSVALTLLRGARQTLAVELEPRYIVHSELRRTATSRLLGDVGYLYVPSFTLTGTGERVHRLLAELVDGGASSFVLDLRGNGGGSLAELGVLMGAFVDGQWARAVSRGEVVWSAAFERAAGDEIGVAVLRGEDGRVMRSARVDLPVSVSGPLVVLVDEGTSSAAEVVAAVLQATGRAEVVGLETSGNVEVVRTYLLPDQSQVLVAVANLELPDGRPLDRGIAPDAEAHVELRDLARGYDAPVAEGLRLLGDLPFVPGRWF